MGSARVSRVGLGIMPKQPFDSRRYDWNRDAQRTFATAGTRSPARETRALPFRSEFGSSDDARWDKP
jgi:hypothetical protein